MRHFLPTLRKLGRTPGFTFLSLFTLALGIAATTGVFSVVNGVLLRPLPYPDSERLMVVTHDAPGLGLDGMGISEALYLHYRSEQQSFEDIAMVDDQAATLTGGGTPERLRATVATAPYFKVLRTSPALGRAFVEAEEHPDATPVVVVSDRLWRERFGADPGMLGRKVLIDGVEREVIGVMPPGFELLNLASDLWLPMKIDRDQATLGSFNAMGLARLREGVSREAAAADLSRLAAALEEAFPGERAAGILLKAGFAPRVEPLKDEIVGDVRATLWILLGTVGVVLMIACANVANLFLVRAEGRQRETAVRTALGATRGQLSAGAMTESFVLALAAGALGLGLARLAIGWLRRFGPQELPRVREISIDVRVLAVAAGVSIAAGVLFGLIPVWYARLRELSGMLKDGGRAATAGRNRHRARQALVACQVALALLLLVVSGLMVRSYLHLLDVDPGFESPGVLAADLWLPETDYPGDEAVAGFYQRLVERLRALPGVESAGALSSLPLESRFSGSGYVVEDHPLKQGDLPPVFFFTFATPETMETLGFRLVEGRTLELRDQEDRTGAVVITEALARRIWEGESALGKRIGPQSPAEGVDDPWYSVVGVVGDVRGAELTDEPLEMLYFPTLGKQENEWTARQMTLVIRAAGDPKGLVAGVRQTVWDLDPSLPIAGVRALDDVVRKAKAPMAFTMVMLLVAGAVSLALGSVGTFGVVSYVVSQRTGEIGVRMALGARRRDIRYMVLRQGLWLAGAGAAAGILFSAVATRWLESVLFEVEPLDPLTFVTVPLLLVAVAVVASWFPASRASRIAPVVALRHE